MYVGICLPDFVAPDLNAEQRLKLLCSLNPAYAQYFHYIPFALPQAPEPQAPSPQVNVVQAPTPEVKQAIEKVEEVIYVTADEFMHGMTMIKELIDELRGEINHEPSVRADQPDEEVKPEYRSASNDERDSEQPANKTADGGSGNDGRTNKKHGPKARGSANGEKA